MRRSQGCGQIGKGGRPKCRRCDPLPGFLSDSDLPLVVHFLTTRRLRINNVRVNPSFAGLSAAGLCQINFTVPAGLGTGDVALVATVGGASTQPSVVISLQ